MIPTTKFAVSSVQVSQLPIGCDQIEGIYNGASAAWLQVHDACIAPQTGDVPLYELPLSAATQFQETLQVARLELTEGLFVGVSSTEGTYTASASVMDITVWTDIIPLVANHVGSKVNTVASVTAWNGNVTTKKLYGLIITELLGLTQYVYINAIGTNDTALPNQLESNIGFIFTLQPNTTKKFYFGAGVGICPFFVDTNQVVTNGAVNQLYTGCTIIVGNALYTQGQQISVSANAAHILVITN